MDIEIGKTYWVLNARLDYMTGKINYSINKCTVDTGKRNRIRLENKKIKYSAYCYFDNGNEKNYKFGEAIRPMSTMFAVGRTKKEAVSALSVMVERFDSFILYEKTAMEDIQKRATEELKDHVKQVNLFNKGKKRFIEELKKCNITVS